MKLKAGDKIRFKKDFGIAGRVELPRGYKTVVKVWGGSKEGRLFIPLPNNPHFGYWCDDGEGSRWEEIAPFVEKYDFDYCSCGAQALRLSFHASDCLWE